MSSEEQELGHFGANVQHAKTAEGVETLTSMVVAKEKLVRHVKLDNGEVKCPYCHIELVMDAVMETIFLERHCPSCKKAFVIVNESRPLANDFA